LTEADFKQIQESFSHVMSRFYDLVRKQSSKIERSPNQL
jgi:hypothetical protein